MKLAWVSDVHLNFLNEEERFKFYDKVVETECNIVVISGDIAESHNVCKIVHEMEVYLHKPVYFVLGNHDFYGSSVEKVKKSVKNMNWLPKNTGVPLTYDTILMGVDGWGDCRNGDFENSRLVMNDWIYIDELREAYGSMSYIAKSDNDDLKKALQKLADKDASLLKRRVKAAIKKGYEHIIMVSHVPPFEDACLHAGRKSTPGGLPFFSSKILGDSILPIAKKNPKIKFTWLSGHTHSRCKYKPCNNMTVKVAKADYYCPKVEEVIDV